MKRLPLLLLASTLTTGVFAPRPAFSGGKPGDTGTLTFLIARAEGALPLLNVRVEVSGAPSWLQVQAGSPLGPVTIGPNEEFTFRVDYQVGPAAATDPSGAFNVTIRHDSQVLPASKTWRIETQDALAGFRAACTASDGSVCGTRQAPDRTPPVSRVVYDGPVFFSTRTAAYPPTGAAIQTVFISTRTAVRLEAEDPVTAFGETSGVAFIGTMFDRIIVSELQLERSSGTYFLKEDPYALFFAAADLQGNQELMHIVDLRSDGSPPGSSLSAGFPRATLSDGGIVISGRTDVSISALEVSSPVVASGVLDTRISVNGSDFSVVSGTFTLPGPDGPKELRWFSRDNVLNEEAVKSTTVILDATPPALSLSCPSPSGPAFCRVFEGIVPVRGSVSDLHPSSWRLDWAPGRGAVSGFTTIASGTGPASGGLASWDASSLSGYVTLRLSAEDAVANVSTQSVDVYVGDPARVYALGGRKTFDKPSGVAVDASSRVYVADAGRDRVFAYDAQGDFVRAYGTDGRAEPSLEQPSGVALDAAGNVYVADSGNHRVVKLSPEGALLAAWGRSETKRGLRRFKPGKNPGEFRRPGALAVDAAGRVIVADTGNRRLQVLGPDGAVARVIDMPPVPDDDPEEEDDEEDDAEGDAPRSRGVPAAVAVDEAGRIYAADRRGARVLVFDASGNLLRTLADGFEQPAGVAVSRDGTCLAVSDRESDFIRRYDEDGRRLLSFGAEGEAKDAAALPPALILKKPLGLALGPDGALYAADSGNGLVQAFAPPVGPPVVSVGEAVKAGGGFRAAAAAVAAAPASSDPVPAAVATLAAAGGTLRRADRAGVEVPQGALDEGLSLGVYEPAALDGRWAERAKALRRAPAGPAVEFGPHGLEFDRPVTLLLPYDRALAARNGWRAADLTAQHWDEARADWKPLPGQVDEAEGVVRAETGHFSLYQVQGPDQGGTAATPASAADAAFAFRDLYAFPNPARGGRRAVIRLQVGVADSVEVNIYDVSGERVHSGAFGPPTVLDDGNGKGPQWTYDYAWDAGGVGSGVYVFAVTAKKGGQAEVRKSGRLAVLK